jgi:hypothetical protein
VVCIVFHTFACAWSQCLYTAAATSVVNIEHIDDDEETMSISTLTSATTTTGNYNIAIDTALGCDNINVTFLFIVYTAFPHQYEV